MTAAFTHARMVGAKRGRLRLHRQHQRQSWRCSPPSAEMQGIVFIGSGKIAFGKLSQALDYGARTLQIQGDFDACLRRVRQIAVEQPGDGHLPDEQRQPVPPRRAEGDHVPHPRGAGLAGAGLDHRARRQPGQLLGVRQGVHGTAANWAWSNSIPRLAVINASGANTLNELYHQQGLRWNGGRYDHEAVRSLLRGDGRADSTPHTIASAIEIGRPVNLPKALRALEVMDGVVREVR